MAVADYIKRLKVESSGVKLEDGCGLSRNNRMTTDFICRFLAEVKRADYFEDFSKSMALAGENGTVKNMLMDLPSGTKVRVKTGSMTGVRAYAGYVVKPSGEKYSFAIIANDYECTGPQMRAKLEKIISKIAALE